MTTDNVSGASAFDPRVQDFYLRRVAIAANAPVPAPKNDQRFGIPYSIRRAIIPGTKAVESTIVLNDFSGGGGVLQGSYATYPNRYWQALGVDATNPGYLIAAQQVSSTDPVSSSTSCGFHGLNIFSRMIFTGCGSVNDQALFKETSATDPTPTAITGAGTAGRPGAAITGLWPLIIGGATSATQLCIGRIGAVPFLATDATGAPNGAALDNLWNPTWWVCQTSLPGNPIIHQSGNSIYNNGTAASAVNFTPVAATGLSGNIRQGGYLIGEHQLENSPPRVYFVHPTQDQTAGMLVLTSEKLGYVEYVNLEGTDLGRLNFNIFPNGIYGAVWVNGGIAAHDGKRVAWNNGTKEINLRLFEQMAITAPINSDDKQFLRGFAVKSNDLYALVMTVNTTTTTQSAAWWRYSWDNGTWNRISATFGPASQASVSIYMPGWGGYPVSFNTGYSQAGSFGTVTQALWRQFMVTSDENPYLLYRTVRGSFNQANTFAAGTTSTGLVSPIWTLDGLEGHPSVVEEIIFGGDTWATSGTPAVYVAVRSQRSGGATVDFEDTLLPANIAAVDATFSYTDQVWQTRKSFPTNTSYFYNFQVQIAPIVSAGSHNTPNCLPVYLRLITFLDDVVHSPAEIRQMEQEYKDASAAKQQKR